MEESTKEDVYCVMRKRVLLNIFWKEEDAKAYLSGQVVREFFEKFNTAFFDFVEQRESFLTISNRYSVERYSPWSNYNDQH